ncbi:MAG: M28 family peptidase [Thermoanaerobaculia bacterium]|nr:M28 family peptidase [Thermoanaerobaculia bacterium]
MLRRTLRIVIISGSLSLLLLLAVGATLRRPSLGRLHVQTTERADPANLERHTRFLTTEVLPRGSDHPENLEQAARYIESQFLATTSRVSMQSYEARGSEYHNVLAEFGPEDGPRIVVGAHYDAFTLFGDSLPGADDNASGTAGLLELARLLGQVEPSLPITLVAYTLEEPPYFASPLMGSRIHADSLAARDLEVWGMINLEMIGYYTSAQPWSSWLLDFIYPDSGDFIAVVGRPRDSWLTGHVKRAFRGVSTVPIYSFNGPVTMGIDASDHRSYWHNGYDAVMVTDTAFTRNPNYHAETDTAETLDYPRMASVVDGVLNAILQPPGRE